jgi:hypothetical protein
MCSFQGKPPAENMIVIALRSCETMDRCCSESSAKLCAFCEAGNLFQVKPKIDDVKAASTGFDKGPPDRLPPGLLESLAWLAFGNMPFLSASGT